MRVNRHLTFALLILALTAPASVVSAQAGREARPRTGAIPDLGALVTPGTTAWITDSAGREQKTRIVDVSADVVTISAGEDVRRLSAADITRIETPHVDSLLNGALVGAGAAVGAGLILCRLSEPWRNCRDDVGPMLRIGAIGAGAGIAVDALIRGRHTIYESGRGAAAVRVAPLLGRDRKGVRFAVTF